MPILAIDKAAWARFGVVDDRKSLRDQTRLD